MTVWEFAPAKINLALHVLGRRADGYHELDSIVAFADVGDRLSFAKAERFNISASGPFAGALPDPAENIITRAYGALAGLIGGLPPVQITLEKNLPVAAGIGGGSANAAAALRGLIRLFELTPPDLSATARGIGADVPVCLASSACRMRGIGERIEPLADFQPVHALLANPLAPVATVEVFRRLGLTAGAAHHESIEDVANLTACRNDLIAPAISVQPLIAEVLAKLAALPGAGITRMSGSGATCFAVFANAAAAQAAEVQLRAQQPSWWVKAAVLGSSHRPCRIAFPNGATSG